LQLQYVIGQYVDVMEIGEEIAHARADDTGHVVAIDQCHRLDDDAVEDLVEVVNGTIESLPGVDITRLRCLTRNRSRQQRQASQGTEGPCCHSASCLESCLESCHQTVLHTTRTLFLAMPGSH